MKMWFTKKKVIVNGKAQWVKPHYAKVYVHKLPNGKKVKARAGTQIWGMLQQTLRNIPREPGSALLHRKIRPLQWIYWRRGQDLWQATGAMLQHLFCL